jgi:hypothetical protein
VQRIDELEPRALQGTERDGRFVVVKEQVIARLPPRSQLFGVSPDGRRLLVGKAVSPPETAAPGIRVILNALRP